ncbi:MAG: tRNA epoxyqueuosine(34) reductase QueG [Rikenellaceae bacterium]|jgi:epoxyqueuosine reductase|nr:tRNA epoxyqueuosine(34) reductase QueG [Rikenellaceae bacterium]
MITFRQIETLAREAGFDACGVARVRELSEQRERLERWIGRGYCSLNYMERGLDRRLNPAQLVEGARTVVVCAVSYFHATASRVASYALARDYHATIKQMLVDLLARLQQIDPELRGGAFCDAAPLLEKAWAVEAGVGWQGRNGLIINPRLGSFILLGELILDREVSACSEPFRCKQGEGCGECRRCIEACPAGAIVEPHVIDTNRCISRLTIERGAAEAPLHGWIFGCDVCQQVCPHNRNAPVAVNPAFAPVIDPAQLTDDFWRGLTEEQFNTIFGQTPLTRSGYAKIKQRIKFENE